MITLNGIVLSDSMTWLERYAYQPVLQQARRTIGGRLKLNSVLLSQGQPITLQATETSGWMDRTVGDALQLIAQTTDGVYVLNFNGVLYNVAFRHYEKPALDLQALLPRTNTLPTDQLIGTIKLVTL